MASLYIRSKVCLKYKMKAKVLREWRKLNMPDVKHLLIRSDSNQHLLRRSS